MLHFLQELVEVCVAFLTFRAFTQIRCKTRIQRVRVLEHFLVDHARVDAAHFSLLFLDDLVVSEVQWDCRIHAVVQNRLGSGAV